MPQPKNSPPWWLQIGRSLRRTPIVILREETYSIFMLIDSHCHINFRAFKDDADEVIHKTLKQNVWMILPSSQRSTSERAVRIAESYPEGVYAAVGLHPVHLTQRNVTAQEVQAGATTTQDWMEFETRAEEFDPVFYKSLAQSSKKVVAIGECGLDSFGLPKRKSDRRVVKEKQKEVLQEHIKLAQELNLPVIFHCRGYLEDLISLITEYGGSIRGVIHSFTGTAEQAGRLLDLGMYIGFNGIIFKQSPFLPNFQEVISSVPLNRILIETDSPYLIPPLARQSGSEGGQPTERNEKSHSDLVALRNEPLFVQYVAEEIARVKGIPLDEVASTTTSNAKSLFSLA